MMIPRSVMKFLRYSFSNWVLLSIIAIGPSIISVDGRDHYNIKVTEYFDCE